MVSMTIGEVARRVGVRPSAVRYYESVGVLPAPRRMNGRRIYDDSIVPVLAAVQVARRAGFGIADLQRLFNTEQSDTPPSTLWRLMAAEKMADLDAQIARAYHMKTLLQEGSLCECVRLEECALLQEANG